MSQEDIADFLFERRRYYICGDGDNDLPMLEFAGTAVVPQNALPAAQSLATYHADSNDNDGIAKAIEELVL